MSLKIGEELPGGDEQGVEDDWEGEYENVLDEGNNGGPAMGRKSRASHVGAHRHSLIDCRASCARISAQVAWFAVFCGLLLGFTLLLPWLPAFFLPMSQSFGLCITHFMWWMHQLNVLVPIFVCFCSFSLGGTLFHSSTCF